MTQDDIKNMDTDKFCALYDLAVIQAQVLRISDIQYDDNLLANFYLKNSDGVLTPDVDLIKSASQL